MYLYELACETFIKKYKYNIDIVRQELSEFTLVEIVGYEVDEARSTPF